MSPPTLIILTRRHKLVGRALTPSVDLPGPKGKPMQRLGFGGSSMRSRTPFFTSAIRV